MRPPVYTRTIKGKRFVAHRPRTQERAWQGGVDRGPIKNQSATGTNRNTYSQKGPYVKYYKRKSSGREKGYSNRSAISKVRRLSTTPRTTSGQARYYPSSKSKSYVQGGRKNVYWGKVQKKEKGVTTDITGGPLRTRNYRSGTPGLVGRDTLKFYGRRPSGDKTTKRASAGYKTATNRSRGWKGDVAGWPVRSPRAQRDNSQKPLKPTEPGIGAWWLSKIFNKNFKGVRPKDRIPDTREARYSGNIRREGAVKSFGDQGTGYSGNMKRGGGFGTGGAGYSGTMKRGKGFRRGGAGYSGNIKRGTVGGFSSAGAGYSGNIKRSQMRGFSDMEKGYSGNMKRRGGFGGEYIGYSGNIKRGRGAGFSRAGANYRGNQKSGKGFATEYIGYAGNIERVGPVKQFEENGVEYSGFMKRGGRGFSDEGANFQGRTKARRTAKGGGSISGSLWNNNQSALAKNPPINSGGADFSGRTKAKRPTHGGGSVSGVLWNNNESALAKNPPLNSGGADFSGRTKAKRPLKGGGSVSGHLWNNNESALAKNPPMNSSGADFSGRTKARRPPKGGGSVSGHLWNNSELPLSKNPPQNTANINYSGRYKTRRPEKGGGSVSGVMWNNNGLALAKSPPKTAGDIDGLQVRVKQGNYTRNKKASKLALPGIAPTRSSVKASEYSRVMKQDWDYKRNPNAFRYAVKGIKPGKAEARIGDFQGNVKMHKYTGHNLHPDAKFAHSEEDNVKEERGLLTNIKLFWSKMFHKNDNQPSSVKDKGKKLQYDKREKGLWAY